VWLRGLGEQRHSRVLDQTHGILGGVSYALVLRLEAHLSFNCHMLDLKLICLSNNELLIPPVLPLLSAASRILFNLPQLLLGLIIHRVIIFFCDHLLWGSSKVSAHAMMSIRELCKGVPCLSLHILRIQHALWVVVRMGSRRKRVVLKGVAVTTIPWMLILLIRSLGQDGIGRYCAMLVCMCLGDGLCVS
jgi:hypothetical protein